MLCNKMVLSLVEVLSKELSTDEKKDLIDEILSNNEEYKNYLEKITAGQKQLSKSLIENLSVLKLLDDYINLSTENLSYCNELFYKIGMKDGLTILLSAVGDDVNG